MAFRAELEDTVAAEAANRDTDVIGWGLEIDKVGASPHMQCILTNDAGLVRVFTVLFSEGLTDEEIIESCLHDVITEVRVRRAARLRG